MSTRQFSRDELGNLAMRVAKDRARGGGDIAPRLEEVCAQLAGYSKANTEAVRKAYAHHSEFGEVSAWTAWEILDTAKRIEAPSLVDALRTYQLLTYNLDNELTDAIAHDLAEIAVSLAATCAEVFERMSYGLELLEGRSNR